MLTLLLQLYNKLRRLFVDRSALPYIHLQSGKKFVHAWPLPEDVCIEDIAHNLSKTCRYSGAIEGDDTIYSVAEHCVRASYIRGDLFPLEKLLHDGAEYVVQDLNRPLKYSPFMHSVYKFYEGLAEKAVALAFGLHTSDTVQSEVKRVDKILLVTEKRDLFSQDRVMCLNKMDDAEGVKPLPEKIVPWTPEQAKRAFLMRYYELTGESRFYAQKMTFEDMVYENFQAYKEFYNGPWTKIKIINIKVPA